MLLLCYSLQHRTYAHLFDQVKQDWFAVVSILEHTLKTLENQLPVIKSAYLRSDNAGCYHCGNTLLSLDGISKTTGNIYVINKLKIFLPSIDSSTERNQEYSHECKNVGTPNFISSLLKLVYKFILMSQKDNYIIF